MDKLKELGCPAQRNAPYGHSLRPVFFQMHVDPKASGASDDLHTDMTLLFPDTNHFPIPAGSVGFRRPGQIDRFQDIGFSLRVLPVKDIDTG